MSPERDDDDANTEAPAAGVATETEGEEETQPLDLQVELTSPSACERHVTVTISRADVDRYLDNAFGEMMPTAAVPGFRVGRAPRKIVESRFRDEVTEQVKGTLLLDCLEQISSEQHFTAISEPEFDLEAVEVPREGPMTFEFTIEVRPEFEWAGEVSRRVGSAVHAELDRWSRTGSLPRPEDLPASRARYERLLAALGVPAQERRAAVERVIDALARTLRDEKGRWIFAPTHTEVRSEWAVSGILGSELVDAVIDRTFRDAQGTRWIVDFKTSAHEGGALEEFVDNEVRRYREQLKKYYYDPTRYDTYLDQLGVKFPTLTRE